MAPMSNPSVSISIAGAAGRMGQRLCALACDLDGVTLAEAFERPGHESIGHLATPDSDLAIADRYTGKGDVLIDFTSPDATRDLLEECIGHKRAMVIGTTGLDG